MGWARWRMFATSTAWKPPLTSDQWPPVLLTVIAPGASAALFPPHFSFIIFFSRHSKFICVKHLLCACPLRRFTCIIFRHYSCLSSLTSPALPCLPCLPQLPAAKLRRGASSLQDWVTAVQGTLGPPYIFKNKIYGLRVKSTFWTRTNPKFFPCRGKCSDRVQIP